MNNKSSLYLIVTLMMLVAMSCSKEDNKIIALTENYPPYSYCYNDSVLGFSTEIVRELFNSINVTENIKVMKWNDAYKIALTKPNTIIFSLARVKEREDLFHWIGKITKAEANCFALKNTSFKDSINYKDLSAYRFNVVENSYTSNFLLEKGIKLTDENYSLSPQEMVNKLVMNKSDMIITNNLVFNFTVLSMGYYVSDFQEVFKIPELDTVYYLAISKNSDIELVEKLQASYDSLNSLGIINNIVEKYNNVP